MIPNLSHLTHTKKSLTGAELGHGSDPIPRHKILIALMMDLFIVAAVSSIITGFFGFALGSYFSTPILQKVWSLMRFNILNLATLGIISVSYFYLCYYLNAGQTFGAHYLGLRLNVKGHDSHAAFENALVTLGVYLSFGFSAGKFASRVSQHDFRYNEFIGFREMKAPNLVKAIELYSASEEESLEKEAA